MCIGRWDLTASDILIHNKKVLVMSKEKLLEGIKVLDLSRQLAGPFATMTMADLGAEVIKVESVTGDDSRYWGPFVENESCYYWSCNRGKKSIVVDLKCAEGKEIIKKLAQKCDILIENFREGVMERLGLDYDVIKEINPRMIYCHITGYGEYGPDAKRPAVDIAIQATTGLMSITGYPEEPPVRIGISLADLATGIFSIVGIQAAYIRALKTGKGQKISLSLMETMVSFLAYHAQGYLSKGIIPQKYGSGIQNIEPYRAVKTKNGYIAIGVGNDTNFKRLCEIMNMPELSTDDRFLHNADRWENREGLLEIVSSFFAQQDNDEIERKMVEKGIPCGVVKNVGEVLESEQVKSMGLVVTIDHPKAGNIPMIRTPLNFSNAENYSKQHPPFLSQHTREVLCQLGYSEYEIKQLAKKGAISLANES